MLRAKGDKKKHDSSLPSSPLPLCYRQQQQQQRPFHVENTRSRYDYEQDMKNNAKALFCETAELPTSKTRNQDQWLPCSKDDDDRCESSTPSRRVRHSEQKANRAKPRRAAKRPTVKEKGHEASSGDNAIKTGVKAVKSRHDAICTDFLSTMPVELVDMVCHFLSSPRDVCFLACTCLALWSKTSSTRAWQIGARFKQDLERLSISGLLREAGVPNSVAWAIYKSNLCSSSESTNAANHDSAPWQVTVVDPGCRLPAHPGLADAMRASTDCRPRAQDEKHAGDCWSFGRDDAGHFRCVISCLFEQADNSNNAGANRKHNGARCLAITKQAGTRLWHLDYSDRTHRLVCGLLDVHLDAEKRIVRVGCWKTKVYGTNQMVDFVLKPTITDDGMFNIGVGAVLVEWPLAKSETRAVVTYQGTLELSCPVNGNAADDDDDATAKDPAMAFVCGMGTLQYRNGSRVSGRIQHGLPSGAVFYFYNDHTCNWKPRLCGVGHWSDPDFAASGPDRISPPDKWGFLHDRISQTLLCDQIKEAPHAFTKPIVVFTNLSAPSPRRRDDVYGRITNCFTASQFAAMLNQQHSYFIPCIQNLYEIEKKNNNNKTAFMRV